MVPLIFSSLSTSVEEKTPSLDLDAEVSGDDALFLFLSIYYVCSGTFREGFSPRRVFVKTTSRPRPRAENKEFVPLMSRASIQR